MITTDTTDKIRDLSIVDVVREYVPDLKKFGSVYKCKSPFTNEKTASFYVVEQKNIFKCFSSGYGGDAITFVMLHEKMSFAQAVTDICKRFSIPVSENVEDSKEDIDYREKLLAVNISTAKKYAALFWDLSGNDISFHTVANEILYRQFNGETVAQWQIGYAPDSWNFLSKILIEHGLYKHGIDLGLIKSKEEKTFDVFRHRLIFPIFNERGNIVAFGGRWLPGSQLEKNNKHQPIKYLNSAESKLFSKSKTLYGLNFAIPHIKKFGFVRLVEGYTDVITMHQNGYCNTVGSMGTAVTNEQVNLLKRYTAKVLLIGDGDAAGKRSMLKSIDLFLQHGFEVQICELPEGKDPDDFLRQFQPQILEYE